LNEFKFLLSRWIIGHYYGELTNIDVTGDGDLIRGDLDGGSFVNKPAPILANISSVESSIK
jgi:hypothetical protein